MPRWLRWPGISTTGLAFGADHNPEQYVSTRLGPNGIRPVLDGLLDAADVHSGLPMALRGRVELTIRYRDGVEFCFLVTLTDDPVAMGDIPGARLAVVGDGETIAPRGVAVLQHSIVDGPWSS